MTTQIASATAWTTEVFGSLPQEVIDQMPRVLIEQAAEPKFSHFYLSDDMIRMNYIRIQIVSPEMSEDSSDVTVKFSLYGRTDGQGNLVQLQKDASAREQRSDIVDISGFNSLRYSVRSLIEVGLLQQADYEKLVRYAQAWQTMLQLGGSQGPYLTDAYHASPNTANSKYRMTLSTTDAVGQAAFFFGIASSNNPNSDAPIKQVPGLRELTWTGLRLGGVGSGGALDSVGTVGAASGQGVMRVPNYNNRAKLLESPTRTRPIAVPATPAVNGSKLF